MWTQLLTQSCLKLLLLLDVVNDKEDVVVFPRFVGNIGLHANSRKMSLKMSSWKGFGESIWLGCSLLKHDEEQVDQPDANPETTESEVEYVLFIC